MLPLSWRSAFHRQERGRGVRSHKANAQGTRAPWALWGFIQINLSRMKATI